MTKLQEFDEASRGPLGSFQFYLKRPTKSLLPYIGCTILLAAIAIDPFTQQILSFQTRHVGNGAFFNMPVSQHIEEWDDDKLTHLHKALLLSILNVPQLPDLTCPGSICINPPFFAIGVTSECKDVTIISSSNCTRETPAIPGDDLIDCNFTTPAGVQIPGLFPNNYVLSGEWDQNITPSNGVSAQKIEIDRKGDESDTIIFQFGILQVQDGTVGPDMMIHDCVFKLCVVEYVGWNVTHEVIHPGLTKIHRAILLNDTQLDTASSDWEELKIRTGPGIAHNLSFSMPESNVASIGFALNANLILTNYDGLKGNSLFQNSNITATMANISAAISYHMIGGPNSTTIPVPAMDEVVIITVRWAWISLPATLVVAACSFLSVIIYRTHRAEHLIWKSSLTPLLLSQESYPVSSAGEKPFWTRSYLKRRTAVIVNHLTK